MSAPNHHKTTPKTSLDYVAEGYWQDFKAAQPVAGGVAYEAQLHECQLDETLASLQRVDTLISHVRRELTKSDRLDETKLLDDDRYRHLLWFLAFYAGRVLARQWHVLAQWYGQSELQNRYPNLVLKADDFYQQMAVKYRDDIRDDTGVFFALEPIGQRLFGHIDRRFQATQGGGPVTSSLYQAVCARLPKASMAAANDTQNLSQSDNQYQSQSVLMTKTTSGLTKETLDTPTSVKKDQVANTQVSPTPSTPPETIISPKTTAPTLEMFSQLLLELDDIEVAQSAGVTEYQQARKILDQFERYIAQQQKPRYQVRFSDQHKKARRQALLKLQNAAKLGHTSAMLRMAMYQLLDEGLDTDLESSKEAGVALVKQAADKQDSRAQRLLSKMYYQGVGVAQDLDSGNYWLAQAAKNGHAEAAELEAQWQKAQALITTQQQEQHSIKRYQLLIAAILVLTVLLFIFV